MAKILWKSFEINLCSSPRGYYIQVVIITVRKTWWGRRRKVEYYALDFNYWENYVHNVDNHYQRMRFSNGVLDKYTTDEPSLSRSYTENIAIAMECKKLYAELIEKTYRELEVIDSTTLTFENIKEDD